VSKSERRAGMKEYQKAWFTCTEIQISIVSAPSQVCPGAVVNLRKN